MPPSDDDEGNIGKEIIKKNHNNSNEVTLNNWNSLLVNKQLHEHTLR